MSGDRRAVVIGASRGIGRAIVEHLAGQRWHVVATGRDAAGLDDLSAMLPPDARLEPVVADATDPASATTLAGRGPAPDLLVYNAGTSAAAPLARTSLESWREQLDVNATGAFLALRAFVPRMVDRGSGRVVVVASTAGVSGSPYISAYAAAKHAAIGLVRSVAAEVAGSGVTVNAVCPHFVRTPMTDRTVERIQRATGRSRDEALDDLQSSARLGRLVEPEEVAAAVSYLADPASAAINGHTLILDGGGHW